MNKQFTYVDGDGWVGLYVDGNLIYEDHDLDALTVFELMGIGVARLDADLDWIDKVGHFPLQLKEVVTK